MASADLTGSPHAFSCSGFFFEYCDYWGEIMPSCAPCQLQLHTSSKQDSAQVQSRQHFIESGNVIDATQGSSCAGDGGLPGIC